MHYELGKKLFRFFIEFSQFMQVSLVFLAFFTTFYWFLQLINPDWVTLASPFFEPIKDFVHIFYNRTITTEESTMDFSFLIGSFIMLFISWGLKFVAEGIQAAEKKYDAAHFALKKKAEQLFNLELEMEYLASERKNKNFLLLIKFDAKNLKKDTFFDKDATEGSDDKQKAALEDFFKNLATKINFQKKKIEDNMLLYFNNFENIDKILDEFNNNFELLQSQFQAERWQLNYYAAIEVYAEDKEVLEKYKALATLVKLNLKNEIACLGTFKQRYSINKIQRYFLECKGIYKIHGEEEVFCIKNKEKNIKHL